VASPDWGVLRKDRALEEVSGMAAQWGQPKPFPLFPEVLVWGLTMTLSWPTLPSPMLGSGHGFSVSQNARLLLPGLLLWIP
jgi:hypothetical protein